MRRNVGFFLHKKDLFPGMGRMDERGTRKMD